jgi:hypothetical protein
MAIRVCARVLVFCAFTDLAAEVNGNDGFRRVAELVNDER